MIVKSSFVQTEHSPSAHLLNSNSDNWNGSERLFYCVLAGQTLYLCNPIIENNNGSSQHFDTLPEYFTTLEFAKLHVLKNT
jgi:hypothetical protein